MEPEAHQQQQQEVKDWQHSQSVENQSPARNNDDDDHDVSPRKETPKPIVSNKQKNQQQSPSSTTRKNKSPIHHRHNTTDDSIPNPNFFLLSSESQNQQQRIASFTPSPAAFTHHHQNSSSSITGSGNFFKQHVSFVNDQPSDPDFIPNPNWFQEHGHQEFRHLNSSPGSTKIDENHQRMLMKARQQQQQQQKEDNDRKSPLWKESYYTSSSPTNRRRPLTRPTTTSANDDQEDFQDSSAFSLRESFHREHGSSPSRTTTTSRSQKTSEALQNSLNELRRKQIIRTALEEGRIVTDEEQNDHDTTTADYWVSPSQQEQSERRIRSSRTLSPSSSTSISTSGRKSRRPTMSVIDDQSHEDAPPSVVEKLKAFASAEEFGEELVIALGKDLFQSLVVGFWVLLRRFGNWIYRLGYFMLFGIALSSKNSTGDSTDIDQTRMENQKLEKNQQQQQQQQGFPSPFPSFYRDAFFSTWSPHELLEPSDLPMTNAFRPSTTARSSFPNQQTAAEMLRPTPAPPFWWIGMMEISGRHFIESQWSQSFVENIYLPAAQEARAMWIIHEDEVMRGSDLVASVARKGVAFSSSSIEDDGDGDRERNDDDPYRYRVSQGGPFRTL